MGDAALTGVNERRIRRDDGLIASEQLAAQCRAAANTLH
jgi:hypothetical protein